MMDVMQIFTFEPLSAVKFVVYAHHGFTTDHKAPDEPACFYGVCRYADLMNAPDARRNVKWREIFLKPGTPWRVETRVLAVYDDEATAKLLRDCYIAQSTNDYLFNRFDGNISEGKRVRCLETGIVYDNQAAACKTLGLTRSALSSHLKRLPGYASVKGLTFERTE